MHCAALQIKLELPSPSTAASYNYNPFNYSFQHHDLSADPEPIRQDPSAAASRSPSFTFISGNLQSAMRKCYGNENATGSLMFT